MAEQTSSNNSGWRTARGDRQRLEKSALAPDSSSPSFSSLTNLKYVSTSENHASTLLHVAAPTQKGTIISSSNMDRARSETIKVINNPPPPNFESGGGGAPSAALDIAFIRVFARRNGSETLHGKETISSGQKPVTWYQFAVCVNAGSVKYAWTVEKRYSECLSLHTQISQIGLAGEGVSVGETQALAPFPGKTTLRSLFSFYGSTPISENAQLSQRQEALDRYFCSLLTLLQRIASSALFAVPSDHSAGKYVTNNTIDSSSLFEAEALARNHPATNAGSGQTGEPATTRTLRIALSILLAFLGKNSTPNTPLMPCGISRVSSIDYISALASASCTTIINKFNSAEEAQSSLKTETSDPSHTTFQNSSDKPMPANEQEKENDVLVGVSVDSTHNGAFGHLNLSYGGGESEGEDCSEDLDHEARQKRKLLTRPCRSARTTDATPHLTQSFRSPSRRASSVATDSVSANTVPPMIVYNNSNHCFTVLLMFPYGNFVSNTGVVDELRTSHPNVEGPISKIPPSELRGALSRLPFTSLFLDIRESTLSSCQVVITGRWPTMEELLACTAIDRINSNIERKCREEELWGSKDAVVLYNSVPSGGFEVLVQLPDWVSLADTTDGSISQMSMDLGHMRLSWVKPQ